MRIGDAAMRCLVYSRPLVALHMLRRSARRRYFIIVVELGSYSYTNVI